VKKKSTLQRLSQFFRERALRTPSRPLSPRRAPLAPPRWTLIDHRRRSRHRSALRALARNRSRSRRLTPAMALRRRMVRRPFRPMFWSRFGPPLRSIPRPRRAFRLGRLRGIRAEQTILKRRPIEAADYGVHFLGIRRFNERESLGLLCFRIADNLDRICDQVFGCQPALNIVRGYPNGQVAQKDGKTHSVVVFDSIGGGFGSSAMLPRALPAYHTIQKG
jgi:hypothetical protein